MTHAERIEQQNAIDNGDANHAYLLAYSTDGADISALEDVVLAYGLPLCHYMFARDISGANIQALYVAAEGQGFSGLDAAQIGVFRTLRDKDNLLRQQGSAATVQPTASQPDYTNWPFGPNVA